MIDPDNTKFMTFPDEMKSREAAHGMIQTTIKNYANAAGSMALAVCGDTDSTIIGACGAFELSDDEIEIFILVFPEHQKHGHASRALKRLISYLRIERLNASLSAFLDPGNEISKKILMRLGFVEHGEFTVNGKTGRKLILYPACD